MDIAQAYVQILPSTDGMGSNLKDALTSAGDIAGDAAGKSAGGKFAAALGVAGKIGAAAIGAATTAVTAFGTSSVQSGMNFDAAMSQVAATMGKPVSEIQNLRDFAQEMGSTTAFSATEAAEALNYMALAGYDAETSMKMLPSVLDLAAAGGMDLATASDMITDTQSALNLSLGETSTMVDQMAKTSSTTNTSVSQLGDAMLKIGATARGVKGGTAELSQVLGVLADNGIKGSEGGTHLRNALLSLQTPTKSGTEALEQLGMTYDDMYDSAGNMRSLPEIFLQMQGAMEGMTQQSKDAIISGIFNKTDLAAVNALIGTTSERWDEVGTAIAGATGVDYTAVMSGLDEIAKKYETVKDGVATGIDTGAMLDWIEAAIQQGETAEQIASEISSTFGISMTDAAAAVSTVETAFDNAQGAAKAMADTQLDNLAGDITLFKSALEGAQIAVSDQLTPTLREFVTMGTEGLSELTSAIRTGDMAEVGATLGGWLSDALAHLTEMLPKIVEAGTQVLTSLIQGISENIPQIATSAMEIVTNIVTTLTENLPTVITAGMTLLTSLLSGIGDSLPELIPATVTAILDSILGILDNIDQLVDAGINLMMGLATGIINAIPIIIEKVPEIITKLLAVLSENYPKIAQAGVDLLSMLVDNIPGIISSIVKELPGIITAIVNFFIGMAPQMLKIGADLLAGIAKGIAVTVSSVITAVKDFATSIINAVKGFFGIHSPSTVFQGIGQNLMTGLLNGLKAAWGGVTSFFSGIGSKILSLLQGVPGNLKTLGGNIMTGLSNGISAARGGLTNALSAVQTGFGNFMNGLNNMKSSLATIGGNLMTGLANGITNAASRAWTAAQNAASSLVRGVKSIFGVHSPSTIFAGIGENLDEGLAKGIISKADIVDRAMQDVSTGLIENGQVNLSSAMAAPAGRGPAANDDMKAVLELLKTYLPELLSRDITLNGSIVGAMAPDMDKELGLRAFYQNREAVAL